MMLTLAICDRDLSQALRLVKWIGFLSSKNGNSMLEESCLLVVAQRAARRAQFKELCWIASKIFREARCFVPPSEHEVGWPGSANWMFSQALLHIEEHFMEDCFFLEPDGIPLTPEWYDKWLGEWADARSNGKSFLGGHVPHTTPHMTGIAIYGADWRDLAPMLVQSPDHDAFDCYGAPQLMAHAQFTPLIQHVFRRHDPGWAVPSVGILDRRAVLFHQDKKGVLFPMLDAARFGGECADHPLFGYRNSYTQPAAMRRFYSCANATKTWKSHGYPFVFDKLEAFGGSIPGVFTTEFEGEQNALADLASNPVSGIREISQEEWEQMTKKKWVPLTSSASKRSSEILPGAPILATPSQSPAVLVEEPLPPSTDISGATRPAIKDIDEVLKVSSVVPSEPHAAVKGKRPRKVA